MNKLSENEILERLTKILEQWQKIVNIEDEIERDIEMNVYIEEMPFYEIKGLLELYQKEKEKNKELTEYLITQNYEINRLNLDKIRLEMSQLPDTAEGYKYLKHEYEMRLGRMNLENYKRNYVAKDKIKAKIEEYKEMLKECNKAQDIDRIKALNERILFGKELLEE